MAFEIPKIDFINLPIDENTKEKLKNKIKNPEEIKTGKDWMSYYCEIDPNGTFYIRHPVQFKDGEHIIAFPEKVFVIPREVTCETESVKQRQKRQTKEARKIGEKIKTLYDEGKITEEEAYKMYEKEKSEIPYFPTIPVKRIGFYFNLRNHYLWDVLRKDLGFSSDLCEAYERLLEPEERLANINIKKDLELIYIFEEAFEKVIKGALDKGKITKDEYGELINNIPSPEDYLKTNFYDNFEKIIEDCLPYTWDTETWLNKDRLLKIKNKLRDDPDFFNIKNAKEIEKEFDIDVPADVFLNFISDMLPSYNDIANMNVSWVKNAFDKIYFPEEITFEGIDDIENPLRFKDFKSYAFNFWPIEKINIPRSVKAAGEYSFANTQIKEFIIPRKINKGQTVATDFIIDEKDKSIFINCSDLITLELGNNTKYYPKFMCLNCVSLKEHAYSQSLIKIEESAFENCKNFENKKFPRSLKEIDAMAFKGCAFSDELFVPGSIEKIWDYAFYENSKLKSVSVGTTALRHGAFGKCKNLHTVEFRDGCKVANLMAFKNDNIKKVFIPNSVKTIEISNSMVYTNTVEGSDYEWVQKGLKNTKVTFNGTAEQLLNVEIVDLKNFDNNFHLSDINTKESVENGKLKFVYGSDICWEIEVVKEKDIEDASLNFINNFKEKNIDKDKLVELLAELIKVYENQDAVFSAIDESFGWSDVKSAILANDIKLNVRDITDEYFCNKEIEKLTGKDR